MRTTKRLRKDFDIYFDEIERCEKAKCWWALLHVLLALPDVCASMETDLSDKNSQVGDRYVTWCETYLPRNASISGSDRYQMRNALLHRGSTTAENLKMKHHTGYQYFSYVAPDTFDVSVHETTNPTRTILNVHVGAMAAETKQALESWFSALQCDPIKMSHVERNISRLIRIQPKNISVNGPDKNPFEKIGLTGSST